ncbi:MAG: LysE family translocator, partial [Blastochloris sp.]|nr:LysE family translocator [Blastochloris sp.]
MFEPSTLFIFLGASLALLLTPGPAVLYIVARSVEQGRRAGVVSALGVGLGTLGHVLAATLGLSALLVSSVLAFTFVQYAGALYLIYLGVQKLREPPRAADASATPRQRMGAIFRQGVVVNLLNPKTALFFFAFLPHFVDPAAGSVALQILLLGGLFVALGMLSDSLYALLAGTLGQWLKSSPWFAHTQRSFSRPSLYRAWASAPRSQATKSP